MNALRQRGFARTGFSGQQDGEIMLRCQLEVFQHWKQGWLECPERPDGPDQRAALVGTFIPTHQHSLAGQADSPLESHRLEREGHKPGEELIALDCGFNWNAAVGYAN